MASKLKRARMAPVRNLNKTFLYWAISVFVIKLLIIFNIQGGNYEISGRPFFLDGVWPGADGENYLKGYEALSREGLFSKEGILNYWPAGYPLVIFFLSLLGKSWVLTTLSIIQSAIFSYSVYIFSSQISRTRLKKFSYFSFILIIFNPTLTLSSITIGYESLTASGFLITLGIILRDLIDKNDKTFLKNLLYTSTIFGLLSFMQPRLIISGILINVLWVITRKGFKASLILVIASLILTLSFPTALLYRNYKAVGLTAVSTNLGVTMNIGAGDGATGGYMKEGYGVPCQLSGTPTQQDSQRIKCVLNWYIQNPTKSIHLFFNKTIYFWSPWFNSGFMNETRLGTMGRNPWLSITPIRTIASTPEGAKLVFGGFGKFISWIWVLGGLFLMFYGFLILWRQRSLERFIASSLLIAISINWLVSLISIGDHRFRLPIMGLSLFLQGVGLKTLFKGGKAPIVDGPSLR